MVLPYLKPSDVLSYLLVNEPWILLGGLKCGGGAEDLLKSFWRLYKLQHGSHEVFKMESDNTICLARTIPILLHGDGGRTQKKQPLEVVSLLPLLGVNTFEKALKCSCPKTETYSGKHGLSDPMVQRLNHQNHSYLTHFLLFAFPSKRFRLTPGLLQSMLEAVSKDLGNVCRNGIRMGDDVYNVAVVGMTGDLEYHAKIGLLTRSYQNVGHRNFLPICPECLAGDIRYPFEDVSSNPLWKQSLYRSPPWSQPPPFRFIPFEDWNSGAASRFFMRDTFHIFRLGIARNFIGSTIVLFCWNGVFDSDGGSLALGNRLIRAWSSFMLWCDTQKVSPSGLRSFSKEKLHMPTTGSFPWLGCKGSDSIIILKWLRFLSGLHGALDPSSRVFPLIFKAAENGLQFQSVHRHGIWLKPDCRDRIRRNAKDFVQTYAWLADYALQNGWQLYAMVPKIHAMDHIRVCLEQSSQNQYTLNPAIADCSMSEDFIGRVSRQSRRISYVQIVENTLLAYKVKARFVLQRFKKRKRDRWNASGVSQLQCCKNKLYLKWQYLIKQ